MDAFGDYIMEIRFRPEIESYSRKGYVEIKAESIECFGKMSSRIPKGHTPPLTSRNYLDKAGKCSISKNNKQLR